MKLRSCKMIPMKLQVRNECCKLNKTTFWRCQRGEFLYVAFLLHCILPPMHRFLSRIAIPAVLTLVLLSSASMALAVMYYPSLPFTDVPQNAWFAPYVEQATSAGIVSGYKDPYGNFTGRFGPENAVTVGEALKIAMEGAGHDTSRGVGFGHWAAKYMSVALGLGFDVALIPSLNLDRPATRAEVASLVADSFLVTQSAFADTQYVDVIATTPYAAAIQALSRTGIISGDTDASGNATGRFRPGAQVNRAEMVKIVMGARAVYDMPGRSSSSWSSSWSSSRSSSRSSGSCSIQDCGPAPGMPNWQCPDGSLGGPSCERLPDSRCGWLIRQCPTSSSRSSRSSSSSSSSKRAVQTYNINYTDTGFQPSFIAIRVGDKIRFRNESGADMWVASNDHPFHDDYVEFDAHGSVGRYGEYIFTFDRVGTWGFHNHVNHVHEGVVSVDQ